MSTGASEAGKIFAALLRQELRAGEGDSETVPDSRAAYREAACLLTRFDPMLLRLPGEDHASGGAVLELLDDCTTMGMGMKARAVWALKADARDQALRGLSGPEAARRALECNLDQFAQAPGPERICLAYLSGRSHQPAAENATELADTLQAVLWLSCVPGMTGLPDAGELQHTLERARLLEPLERLVQAPFQGRTGELDELRDYIGTSPDPATPVPPLVIHGPGGMGKSTLLARFLLDSIHERELSFPFAYIDFERPTLSIHEPVTLIAEAARQLGIQYPAHRDELEALAYECQQTARGQREGQEQVTQLHELATTRTVLGRSSSHEFQIRAAERDTDLIRRTAELLVRVVEAAGMENPPFVLVIDSFEEAQYRGSPVMGRLWRMCVTFQSVYPGLRVVVSGRAPVDHPARTVTPQDIELHELDRDAAISLLTACGVTDPVMAGMWADRVGGHPLSLKLAARAVTLAGGEAESMGELLSSMPAQRRQFTRRVDRMLIQGLLYDRILNHIANQDVRRVAHPGLVLRIITPEIIKDVLADPCGLPVETLDDAQVLFDELSRLDLVEPAGPGAVRHRGDVRAIMLRLPGGDRTGVMRTIERRAVEYHATREGLEARAEEIYHRLRLDENPRSVEERWLPGVERFLIGAQQDMTPRAAGLLTAKLGGGASDHVLEGADQEDWERIAAREVEDLLAQGFPEAALVRLGERRPWTACSPLHSLLAETMNRLGQGAQARGTVSQAVTAAAGAGCAERQLELLLLSARLAEEAGDVEGAGDDLRAAEDIAVDLGQDLEAMGALLARARLAAGADEPDAEADSRLAERLHRLPDAVLADQPALVRAVASQIYPQDPNALGHALDVVGLPGDDEALETLGTAMRRAAARQPRLLGELMDILRDAADPAGPHAGTGPSSTTEILRLARDRGTLDPLAQRLLAVDDESGEIAAGVAAAMRVGASGLPTPSSTAHTAEPENVSEGNGPPRPGRS
ncbi:AAA ATPase-like protein [Streptomyces sp. SLBN-118]|uniref:ATP-binding protein n=1 Tax=Streptomyces sp. SLBN-118 TaxID=2768454 RepID=UPI0011504D89|nr:ATP-binding protein [Streptomyces sp. SLBN-118]TQK50394.1 AAA ATPase-like protein [Streptomyces sp. SLBN-118]